MTRPLPSPEQLLRLHGLRPKKAWGQNFLRDGAVLDRVAAALEAGRGDRVVELGAGLGHLTARLAASGAEIVAVERDRDMLAILEAVFESDPGVRVMAADAKKIDLAGLRGGGPRLLVAGNLPYHLTTPILFHLLDQREHVARAVIMVQKEVADRLVAPPGNKDYGIISVQARMWAEVRALFDVSPGSFHPPPKVVSTLLGLDFRDAPVADPGDPELFRKVVRGAFSQRRKTIRNTLKSSGVTGDTPVEEILEIVGIDPTARPETISIEGFAAVSRAICEASHPERPPDARD